MAAKSKAAKAGAAAVAVKNSPYIKALAEDEELRANLYGAYESARTAVGRLQNGKHPTKQVFDDKKLQKDVKAAAESFKEAAVALREAPHPKKKKRRGDLPTGGWLARYGKDTEPRPGALVEVRDFIAGE